MKTNEYLNCIRTRLNLDEFRGYCHGNIIKYIFAYGEEYNVENLKNARMFLNWLIESIEEEVGPNPDEVRPITSNRTVWEGSIDPKPDEVRPITSNNSVWEGSIDPKTGEVTVRPSWPKRGEDFDGSDLLTENVRHFVDDVFKRNPHIEKGPLDL